jgi:ribosomal-protein-alanine N-acetyltransferase
VTITLRRWRENDAALIVEAGADEYTALIEGLNREGWLQSQIEDGWAHVIERDGEAIGGVAATRRHVPGVAEVGYWVLERARGHNAATEATRLLTAWLFEATNIERVQATVEPSNVASQRVLEKAGFQREGLLRGYASWGGERRDVFLYGKLEGD